MTENLEAINRVRSMRFQKQKFSSEQRSASFNNDLKKDFDVIE